MNGCPPIPAQSWTRCMGKRPFGSWSKAREPWASCCPRRIRAGSSSRFGSWGFSPGKRSPWAKPTKSGIIWNAGRSNGIVIQKIGKTDPTEGTGLFSFMAQRVRQRNSFAPWGSIMQESVCRAARVSPVHSSRQSKASPSSSRRSSETSRVSSERLNSAA